MKVIYITLMISFFSVGSIAQESSYGSCSERAEVYQKRYVSGGQSKDLACHQKALERELSGSQQFNCPKSAQHYLAEYERSGNSSDLVCYQQELKRELK